MKRFVHLIIYMSLLLPMACDVHEWPDKPDSVQFDLRLDYETGMVPWYFTYDGENTTEQGLGDEYDNSQGHGRMRYIVRACPVGMGRSASQAAASEFLFTKDVSGGYDNEVRLDLAPGDYDIMVWSDLAENDGDAPFYDAGDFAEITLQGDHEGGNDYRDAYRGTGGMSLVADVEEHAPATAVIPMQRPLAKFELVTDDLDEFMAKEARRMAQASGGTEAPAEDDAATRVDIGNYKVVVYYTGFMPCAYSMYTDKPVDSATGVAFRSTLKRLGGTEASLGFDYVFVNGTESAVTVRVAIYDADGKQVGLTDPVNVPLKRNRHTVLHGHFLTTEASGGITINPGYDGDHNVVFP